MLPFQNYFSAKSIIAELCKYRIKHAKTVHKYHLLRDISLHPKSLLLLHNKRSAPPDLEELFPSRRNWLRPSLEKRKKINSTQDIRLTSLYNTINSTHINVSNGKITPPDWYIKLQKFIITIQERASDPDSKYLKAPILKPIKKDNTKACKICRPISLYDLEDRILIGFTAKYLTDLFDPHLHDCSYAFRSTTVANVRTHHDTIKQIITYRKERKNIYVAEADLEKFFDIINHNIIVDSLNKFISKVNLSGQEADKNSIKIFHQYLASYTFNKDVFIKNGTEFFVTFNIPGGRFEWPLQKLKKIYQDLDAEDIGIPQGGALSCLIANMVLHEVDEDVDSEPKDAELLYLRFCDDMVILHTNQSLCTDALNRYEQKIASLNLLMHPPEFILGYGKAFWQKKSKRPYHWSPKIFSENSVPWLGFVGYQIRYDGVIRVRKKSIEKEAAKQKNEMFEVLKALNLNEKTSHQINENSRKSRQQQVFALENRLISMSVGRVKLYNYKTAKNGLCWTNGFQCLDMNFVSRKQCRYLDKNRQTTLRYFKRSLSALVKKSENPDEALTKKYFGHPFSYHGFLKN